MASTSNNQTLPSSTSPPRWDVFLSFRGLDTRHTFTDFLYGALHRAGIQTFRDDFEVRGEVISNSLLQAIRGSRTFVVVFSENYASSKWCLDELVEILDCYKSMGRLVLPIFFNIEPSVVENQTGSFSEAFAKHETRFEPDRLEKWRATLTNVGNFSGYQVRKNMSQIDIINKVADRILLEINPMTLNVAQYPVGLDSPIKDVTALLSSDTESVIRIGLYGMGGVGKTTLAKAVYNQIYHRFHGSCFLANIREVSGLAKGLVSLQQQLINGVLKCKNITIDNVDQGIELIRARICFAKVLIVFDDLDSSIPLEFLEGPFASGSKMIITTRNEDLLDSIKVKYRYKVNELGDAESRQLFTRHAFGDNMISPIFKDLAEEILQCAGGLPLALKLSGSNLSNQSEEGWRWYIDKLKRVSPDDVQKTLMLSFDALKLVDPTLPDIFLDIACFFVGWKKTRVAEIMETCYTFINHHIDTLHKRCLLTFNDDDELDMHDLLRDMGREIASNNSPGDPSKHSRLWVARDIFSVLKQQKGTKATEGIISSNYSDYLFSVLTGFEEVSLAAETFNNMSRLRFLYLENVNFSGSFEHAFEDLRWLCLSSCNFKDLPSEFYPQKLVTLELHDSRMRTIWELNVVSRIFNNLKNLKISYCEDLTTTPDFTKLPNLETLNLMGCHFLEEIHVSIGSLVRLVFLNLWGCLNLKSIPDSICNLRALEHLEVSGCSKLEALPVRLGSIKSLVKFDAEDLTISKLPDTIGSLSKLVELSLSSCNNLETLPDTICRLRSLQILDISHCKNIKALPKELGNIESLTNLIAWGLTISKLPYSVGHLSKLVELDLNFNNVIDNLPKNFCNLRSLTSLKIHACTKLQALPMELGKIESLVELNAKQLRIAKLPDSIGRLSKLVVLKLDDNRNLKTLPHTICNLRSLEALNICRCPHLLSIPELPSNLKTVRASNCSSMKRLPNLSNLKQLECLDLGGLNGLTEIQGLKELTSIKELHLQGCNSSLLPSTFTRSFFQVYSGFGHRISIYAPSEVFPNWTSKSPYWISQSSNVESTVSLNLPPNMSHNFWAMIICCKHRYYVKDRSKAYSVKTTTNDFAWRGGGGEIHYRFYSNSSMDIVPRSIFSVTDSDNKIELSVEPTSMFALRDGELTSARNHILGIHLLYKTKITLIDKYNSTSKGFIRRK